MNCLVCADYGTSDDDDDDKDNEKGNDNDDHVDVLSVAPPQTSSSSLLSSLSLPKSSSLSSSSSSKSQRKPVIFVIGSTPNTFPSSCLFGRSEKERKRTQTQANAPNSKTKKSRNSENKYNHNDRDCENEESGDINVSKSFAPSANHKRTISFLDSLPAPRLKTTSNGNEKPKKNGKRSGANLFVAMPPSVAARLKAAQKFSATEPFISSEIFEIRKNLLPQGVSRSPPKSPLIVTNVEDVSSPEGVAAETNDSNIEPVEPKQKKKSFSMFSYVDDALAEIEVHDFDKNIFGLSSTISDLPFIEISAAPEIMEKQLNEKVETFCEEYYQGGQNKFEEVHPDIGLKQNERKLKLRNLDRMSKEELLAAGFNVKSVNVRHELQTQDVNKLTERASLLNENAPIRQHLSASAKLSIMQLAKKAVTQSNELEKMFANNRSKKRQAANRYAF